MINFDNSYKDCFQADDYFDIYNKYFRELSGDPNTSYPAGINDVDVLVAKKISSIPISANDIAKYYNDPTASMNPYKEGAINLFSAWDNHSYKYDEISITNSVTVSSIIVLEALKALNIGHIIFDTPCYYATKFQAEMIGFVTILLPTYIKDNYEFKENFPKINDRKAIWLTQPKISLGVNQSKRNLMAIEKSLEHDDFIIIDEATELFFPSHLYDISNIFPRQKIIRLKSIFKGMGLNGPRVAAICHPIDFKPLIDNVIWFYQGGVDIYSLKLALHYINNISIFKDLLETTRMQVINSRNKINLILPRRYFVLPKVENGYTSSIGINLGHFPGRYKDKRVTLLNLLNRNKIAATLGASMYFAHDPNIERIRINLLLPQNKLVGFSKRISNIFLEKEFQKELSSICSQMPS